MTRERARDASTSVSDPDEDGACSTSARVGAVVSSSGEVGNSSFSFSVAGVGCVVDGWESIFVGWSPVYSAHGHCQSSFSSGYWKYLFRVTNRTICPSGASRMRSATMVDCCLQYTVRWILCCSTESRGTCDGQRSCQCCYVLGRQVEVGVKSVAAK